jgi:hypothetical protein
VKIGVSGSKISIFGAILYIKNSMTYKHPQPLPHTATHCHTLPHTATHCHTLPHCHTTTTLPHCHTTATPGARTKKMDSQLAAYQNDRTATATNLQPLPPRQCQPLSHCHPLSHSHCTGAPWRGPQTPCPRGRR